MDKDYEESGWPKGFLDYIWKKHGKCPNHITQKIRHDWHVHTFVCEICGHSEWYGERWMDNKEKWLEDVE